MLAANNKMMMMNDSLGKQGLYALAVIIISLLLTEPVKALTIEQLVDKGEIELSVRLQNQSTPIVRQQLIFEIEVATKYLFAYPTKYKPPKVKNTASSPRKSPGFSSRKVVNGESWNSQVREFALYPIKQGQYRIPPVEVIIAINTPDHGVIEGTILTRVYNFEVTLPTELNNINEFIVSTDVQMEINDNQPDIETFSIGDAFSITVTISATDVPGMLLPTTLQQDIEGLSIYRKSPKLLDKTNRGFLTGRRTDSVTYIFEQAGNYQIPQQIIYWWNPELQELNELIIPDKTWLVDGAVVSNISDSSNVRPFEMSTKSIWFLGYLLLASLLILIAYKHWQWLLDFYVKITKRQQRILRKDFIKAVNSRQYLLACQNLYELINCYSAKTTNLKDYYLNQPEKMIALQNLLAFAYNDNNKHLDLRLNEIKRLVTPNKGESKRSSGYDQNLVLRFSP